MRKPKSKRCVRETSAPVALVVTPQDCPDPTTTPTTASLHGFHNLPEELGRIPDSRTLAVGTNTSTYSWSWFFNHSTTHCNGFATIPVVACRNKRCAICTHGLTYTSYQLASSLRPQTARTHRGMPNCTINSLSTAAVSMLHVNPPSLVLDDLR